MAEKLTKTALNGELTRRIEWFQNSYGFNPEHNDVMEMADYPSKLIAYGRYLALIEQRWQIKSGLFIGGYAC